MKGRLGGGGKKTDLPEDRPVKRQGLRRAKT